MRSLSRTIIYRIIALYGRKALCGKQSQNQLFAKHARAPYLAHRSFVKSFFVLSVPRFASRRKGDIHLFKRWMSPFSGLSPFSGRFSDFRAALGATVGRGSQIVATSGAATLVTGPVLIEGADSAGSDSDNERPKSSQWEQQRLPSCWAWSLREPRVERPKAKTPFSEKLPRATPGVRRDLHVKPSEFIDHGIRITKRIEAPAWMHRRHDAILAQLCRRIWIGYRCRLTQNPPCFR